MRAPKVRRRSRVVRGHALTENFEIHKKIVSQAGPPSPKGGGGLKLKMCGTSYNPVTPYYYMYMVYSLYVLKTYRIKYLTGMIQCIFIYRIGLYI